MRSSTNTAPSSPAVHSVKVSKNDNHDTDNKNAGHHRVNSLDSLQESLPTTMMPSHRMLEWPWGARCERCQHSDEPCEYCGPNLESVRDLKEYSLGLPSLSE